LLFRGNNKIVLRRLLVHYFFADGRSRLTQRLLHGRGTKPLPRVACMDSSPFASIPFAGG
jgi:hypothetical protein